ncbi:MAG: alpha/beta hydrolase [Chloroflexi bacterium]|nr:alpha/beta hydrolase [Chloroflexota bacterium]
MTTATTPASGSVQASGLALHYLDWGNAGATPLVLLHGLGGSARDWRRVAAHFAPRYHVIALDQRGHGDSPWAAPDAYSTDDAVADLEAAIEGLGLPRVILCGHSMGGMNTIAYTARHPERVICALANDIPPALGAARHAGPSSHPLFPTREAAVAARRAESPTTPDWALELLADARLKPVPGGLTFRHDPAATSRWRWPDLWPAARTISRPILFIRGGRSPVLSAETLMEMDLAIAPARSITLEQAGHATFLDMEHEWLAAAEAFFAAHAR